jgi:RNA 3'-terminal phosphate cyclase
VHKSSTGSEFDHNGNGPSGFTVTLSAEALRVIHVRDEIDVGRSGRVPAGDGTVQTQVQNPCGPQLRLVRTQRCEDVLTVY